MRCRQWAGASGVRELAVERGEPEVPRLAHVAVAQQLLKEEAAPHPVGWRAEHGHELRTRLRRREHLPALAQVHRHAGLAENVFARFERGDGDGRMQDRRRADPDDVEIGPVDELGPVVHHVGNVKIARDRFGGFAAGIADGDDLDLRQRLQAGQVTLAHDAARADEADAKLARRGTVHAATSARGERKAR